MIFTQQTSIETNFESFPSNHKYLSMSGWKFGLGVCLTYLSIDYTASTASIFNLFILSLDRWAAAAASVNRMAGRWEDVSKAKQKADWRKTNLVSKFCYLFPISVSGFEVCTQNSGVSW